MHLTLLFHNFQIPIFDKWDFFLYYCRKFIKKTNHYGEYN